MTKTIDELMKEIGAATLSGDDEKRTALLEEMVELGRKAEKKRKEELAAMPMKSTRFADDRITSCPNDVITIMYHGGLSSSISLHITNPNPEEVRHEDEYKGISNCLEGWKYLKQVNEIAARTVLVELEDKSCIPYEESMPYIHRFGR